MSEFGFEQDGEKAIEETVDGTLQSEVLKVSAEGFTPPVKQAKKLPARKPIKVEEAKPPFELPSSDEVAFIPAFTIVEETNVEVVEQQVETIVPEAEVKQAEIPASTKAAKQVITPGMLRDLRANDPPHKRSCSVCGRRVPLAKIGKGEVCEDCK